MRDADVREAPCQVEWDRIAAEIAEKSMTLTGDRFRLGARAKPKRRPAQALAKTTLAFLRSAIDRQAKVEAISTAWAADACLD
jgi:hypothetical protein